MDEETTSAEIVQRDEQPSGPVCQKCKRPLIESEKAICAACKQQRKERLGQLATVALGIVAVFGGIAFFILKALTFPFRRSD